jgi:hypothetical protein
VKDGARRLLRLAHEAIAPPRDIFLDGMRQLAGLLEAPDRVAAKRVHLPDSIEKRLEGRVAPVGNALALLVNQAAHPERRSALELRDGMGAVALPEDADV